MAVSTINILIICVTLIVLVAISNKKKWEGGDPDISHRRGMTGTEKEWC